MTQLWDNIRGTKGSENLTILFRAFENIEIDTYMAHFPALETKKWPQFTSKKIGSQNLLKTSEI